MCVNKNLKIYHYTRNPVAFILSVCLSIEELSLGGQKSLSLNSSHVLFETTNCPEILCSVFKGTKLYKEPKWELFRN